MHRRMRKIGKIQRNEKTEAKLHKQKTPTIRIDLDPENTHLFIFKNAFLFSPKTPSRNPKNSSFLYLKKGYSPDSVILLV